MSFLCHIIQQLTSFNSFINRSQTVELAEIPGSTTHSQIRRMICSDSEKRKRNKTKASWPEVSQRIPFLSRSSFLFVSLISRRSSGFKQGIVDPYRRHFKYQEAVILPVIYYQNCTACTRIVNNLTDFLKTVVQVIAVLFVVSRCYRHSANVSFPTTSRIRVKFTILHHRLRSNRIYLT